jgi:hypothetical protein
MEQERILALEVRLISFGFCVFEGPDQLLDWGIRSFRRGVNQVKVPLEAKITMLLDSFEPKMLVTNVPLVKVQATIIGDVRALARSRSIHTHMIARSAIRELFKGTGENKHEIATAIADRLSDLAELLPAKRRTWETEHYRMRIFDAAAIGLTYFTIGERHPEEVFPPASH